jgi:hypothetical protein
MGYWMSRQNIKYLEKEGIIEGVVIKIRFLEVRFN